VTFFLSNPGAAKSIAIPVYLDDGPSLVYVDGNLGANRFAAVLSAGASPANVQVPSGPFALSFIACSNNGPSIGMQVPAKFITANGLTVDLDRTYHRNGQ
jgi:hypothetical protein